MPSVDVFQTSSVSHVLVSVCVCVFCAVLPHVYITISFSIRDGNEVQISNMKCV